jgi:Ca2+/H+ antiporter, TMEM165/GDT1 family
VLGAILLIQESLGEPEHVDVAEQAERQQVGFVRIAAASFGVLFAAEWGDASQIATAGLAARQGEPVAVALGAWVALVAIAAIAAAAGRVIVRRVPVRVVHRAAGILFLGFTVVAVIAAVRG